MIFHDPEQTLAFMRGETNDPGVVQAVRGGIQWPVQETLVKVYIAGPIAGMPDGNREAFTERARVIRENGHEPLNPWDISPDGHVGPCIGAPVEHSDLHRYGCFLRADIMEMMFCDAITMLPGWEQSTGAATEVHVATSLGLQVIEVAPPPPPWQVVR